MAALPEDAHRRAKPSAQRKELQKMVQETRWRQQRLQENVKELRMVDGVEFEELRQRVFGGERRPE